MAVSNGFRQPLGNGVLTEAIDGDGFYVGTNFNQYNSGFNAYHLGEDWNAEGAANADLGIPVYAISNGTVVERGVLESFGNYVVIRHDLPAPITINGIATSTVYSLYGHFQNPAIVSVGDVVSIGQQIGNVGATGDADGNPHVHLEIRLGTGAGYNNTDGYAIGGAPPGWVDPTDFINSYRTFDLAGNTQATARAVTVGSTTTFFNDYVGPSDTSDYYRFTTAGTTKFALSLAGLTDDADVYLLNSAGVEVAHSYNFGTAPEAINVANLAAGTYYVQVRPYQSAATNYALGLSAAPLVADTTAPLLSSMSPADNATAVAVGSNIVLTFNEAVMAGSGNIMLYNSNGTVARSIAVTDTAQVSFSGNTVTINPSSDLAASSGYYVNLAAGVIQDLSGNNYAGISGSTAFNFTTGSIPDLAGNTQAAARVVTLGSATTSFTDYIGPSDTSDYYRFTTAGTTKFVLSLTGLTDDADVFLLNSAGVEVAHSYNNGPLPEAINVASLAAGTYYVQVRPYQTAATNYTLGLSATPLVETKVPLLSSMSPSDNATAVAVGSNIVLTFNEVVTAGSGNIMLYNSNGSVARSIAVTDTSQVSFSGNTVTINPTSDLAPSSGYYVNLAASVIQDVAGNNYAGISGSTAFNFTTASIPDLAGNTQAAAHAVTLGSATTSFTDYVGPTDTSDYYKFTTGGATNFALSLTGLTDDADVYLLNSAGAEVTHSYNSGTAPEAINVANLAAGTYYVQVRPYQTAATNYTLGLSGTPLSDTTAPLLSSMSPSDNATAVAVDSNIVLTFNEAVTAGSGNITLYNSSGSVARSIAVTDTSQVSFSGNTVTINPTNDLAPSSGYYVNLAAGVIEDIAGNNYAGISSKTAFNFTTGSIPDVAGNTLATAHAVTLGSATTSFSDYVGPTDTSDYFKFTTAATTNFALSLTGLTDDADVYLLNSAGAEVSHSYNSGTAPEAINVANLAAGTYYVQVRPYQTAATHYNLDLSATDVHAAIAHAPDLLLS